MPSFRSTDEEGTSSLIHRQSSFSSKGSITLILLLHLAAMFFPAQQMRVTVEYGYQNLTSVPFAAINDSVTTLKLSKNNISELSWFPPYKYLYSLDLSFNRLSELPNFQNISCTLYRLRLDHNKITSVRKEHLEILNLARLDLGDNYITAFPDMAAPWDSYGIKIYLDSNEITTIPNIPSLRGEISISDNNIICNCKLTRSVWTRTVGGSCATPPGITGTSLYRHIDDVTDPQIWEQYGKLLQREKPRVART